MALGLTTQMNTGDGSDFTPIILYAAREGRFYIRDRIQGSTGAFENEDSELPTGTKIAFDFGTIQVGYLKFVAGQAPSFAVVPLGKPLPQSPDKDHRQGFRMLVHLGKQHGKRELATTAKTVIGAVDDLHGVYEAAPEAKAGKIPIVEFTGAQRIVTENRHGTQTNFRPNLRIVSWIDRPADLGPRTVPPPGASQTPTQATARSNGAAQAQRPARPVQAPHADEWDTAAMTPQPGGKDDLDDTIPF